MRHSPAKPEASQSHYTFDFEFMLGLYVQKPFPGWEGSDCQKTPHSVATMCVPCCKKLGYRASCDGERGVSQLEGWMRNHAPSANKQAHSTKARQPNPPPL